MSQYYSEPASCTVSSSTALPDDSKPIVSAAESLPEMTLKAIVLSIILTIVLSAANAYLGLKVGITISASIPAAIISMGVLRLFRRSNVLENNIVQTAASAGEALTGAIVFTIPSLLVLHIWLQFDFVTTASIAMIGGIFGVLFSIPLRRVMLANPSLRFPEGTAIGKVLRASADQATGLKELVLGSAVGGFISLAQIGFEVVAGSIQRWTNFSGTIIGVGTGFSPALIAAGFIVGIEVAVSELVGAVIGWFGGIPVLSHIYSIAPGSSAGDAAMSLWHEHIRYMGIGIMFVGGIWTIITLFKPMVDAIRESFSSVRKARLTGDSIIRTERDVPINYVLWFCLLLIIPLAAMMVIFIDQHLNNISTFTHISLPIVCTVIVIILGFMCASICAYFAGLVGSSTCPISGMALIAIIISSLALLAILGPSWHGQAHLLEKTSAASLAVIMCALVVATASISNDTMQDLKAGQMVGATPWKQQFMLIIGVCVAACVIPAILSLLFNAYGIGGVFPRPGMDPAQGLAAPQAGLIAAIVNGAFNNELQWGMIISGCVIAAITIVVDIFLKRRNLRLHVLALGLGVYLPLDVSTAIVIGGVLSYIVQLRLGRLQKKQVFNKEMVHSRNQRGLLLACGLVAGAALMGVVLAIPFVLKGSSDALSLVNSSFVPKSEMIGLFVTIALCVWIYRVICGPEAKSK